MSQTTVDRDTAFPRTGPPATGPSAPGAPGAPWRSAPGTSAPGTSALGTSPLADAPRPLEHEQTRVVLETARAVVERGWLQDGWYRTAPRSVWQQLFGPLPTPDELEGACVVAAVAVSAHAGGSFTRIDRDSGPSIDRLWDALQEHRGRPADGPGAVAPIVRRARMRELVRWNDAPGRTREEVLGVIDRAISRTILDEARAPTPR